MKLTNTEIKALVERVKGHTEGEWEAKEHEHYSNVENEWNVEVAQFSSENLYIRRADSVLLAAAPSLLDTVQALQEEIAALVKALVLVVPYMPSQAEMLDEASLNEGRASEWGTLGVQLRALLSKYTEGN